MDLSRGLILTFIVSILMHLILLKRFGMLEPIKIRTPEKPQIIKIKKVIRKIKKLKKEGKKGKKGRSLYFNPSKMADVDSYHIQSGVKGLDGVGSSYEIQLFEKLVEVIDYDMPLIGCGMAGVVKGTIVLNGKGGVDIRRSMLTGTNRFLKYAVLWDLKRIKGLNQKEGKIPIQISFRLNKFPEEAKKYNSSSGIWIEVLKFDLAKERKGFTSSKICNRSKLPGRLTYGL